jgi:molecular chaperone DnaK
MVKDAEMHAADDKKRRELVDVRNAADSLVYQVEKNLSEHGAKIPAGDKAEIEADVAALKTALEGDNADDIKAKTEKLSQSSMKLGEAIYKASQEDAAGPDMGAGAGSGGGASPDDNVVDADFEEVDDDKKSA